HENGGGDAESPPIFGPANKDVGSAEEEEDGDADPIGPGPMPEDGAGKLSSLSLPVSLGTWTFAGPGPITGGQIPTDGIVSGRLTAIVASPTDANKIFAASAGGGIWKTTDGGANWLSLTDFQANTAVGSMALAPTNPNIIYVGTGEANNSR